MNRIEDIFIIHTAKSGTFASHALGSVPFISNGLSNNGVVGLVTPEPNDKVFRVPSICVSAFAEATPHRAPFIARGNGGSGLVVLEPTQPMDERNLIQIAAFINNQVRWRFNWYRQATAGRRRSVLIPNDLPKTVRSESDFLPAVRNQVRDAWSLNLGTYRLDELFELVPGRYHALNQLEAGHVPVISCGGTDNGIAGFYSVNADQVHRAKLTIALNGSPMLTLWHPYPFAGKDDVAICTPRTPLQVSTLLFIQAIINRERWRFSYYRKCYMGKLRRFSIQLPSSVNGVDEDVIASVVKSSPYWDYVESWASMPDGEIH